MPSQTEDTNHPSTLPPEELNPLMNPLLAQNMGRWAEVYFTNLPENRDQAVLDLLEELRAQAPPAENAAPVAASVAAPPPVDAAAWQAADSEPAVLCPECGYENRADHNFCGACRAQLKGEPGAFAPPDSDPATHASEFDQTRLAEGDSQSNSPDGGYDSFDYRETVAESADALTSPGSNSLRQNRSDDRRSDDRQTDDRRTDGRQSNGHQSNGRQEYDLREDDRPSESGTEGADQNAYNAFRFSSVPEQPRRSYRVYAGVLIAIVIAFLLYRAWSGANAGSAVSHDVPQLPPATTTEGAAPATNGTSPTPAASTPTPVSAPAPQPKLEPVSAGAADRTASSKPSAQTPTLATDAPVLSASGATELALAKSYLNGTDGKERNPAEAADLLWKAVSKQNAEATELLSDLYLKGDGVAKNCDQARVLLDAAASKGRKEAAERLEHLAAFGCQ